MTNDNLSRAQYAGSFWGLFSQTFGVFFRRLGVFLPLVIVFAVLSYLLLILKSFVGLSAVIFLVFGVFSWNFLLMFILLVVLSAALGLLATVTYVYAGSQSLKGEKIGIFGCLGYGFKRLGSAVWISIQVFWYVYKWVLLAMVLIFAAQLIFNQIFISSAYGSVANAGLISPTSPPPDTIVATTTGVLGLSYVFQLFGLALIVAMIVFTIVRGIKSIFSMFVMVQDDLRGGAALNKSKEVVKGKFWKVFGYTLLGGIVYGIIFILPITIINLLVQAVPANNVVETVLIVILSIGIGITGAMMAIFLSGLYLNLKSGGPKLAERGGFEPPRP